MRTKKLREIYLDYAAATPVDPLVIKKMKPFWRDEFANASSTHNAGTRARAAVTAARQLVARALAVKDREIIFTSGATEGNNIAIAGLLRAHIPHTKKMHILLSEHEHPSTEEVITNMGKEKNVSIAIERIPSKKDGIIDVEKCKRMLRPETLLVSTLLVDNITGNIQPIREMSQVILEFRKKNKKNTPYFHTDATQAPRYFLPKPHTLGVDLLTLDGGKLYGPKGVGVLFIKNGTPITATIFGGGQEQGLRSGSLAVPLVVGFAEALSICEKRHEKDNRALQKLKDSFIATLMQKIPMTKIKTSLAKSVPGIIAISIPTIESESLFAKLNARGVYASLGSACESEKVELKTQKKKHDPLRFSFGRETTHKDSTDAIQYICDALPAHAIIKK